MKKVKLSNYNNDWYKPGSKIKILIWYYINILFFINPLNSISSLKIFILRFFGAKIGNNVVIKQSVNVKYPWFLEVGDNVWIGENVWIDNLAKVKIENNVCISQGAMLLCGNHNYKKSTFNLIVKEITLKEGSWVGAKSVVCPGVTLKSHAILSVGSIATKDLDSYSIYQGNPAIKVRERKIEF
ncbi:WcaF family extracellular polysaccharide biosynthesis acetyltransferase [Polaribacter sp. Hel1_85]|uniref:WcaF family extracellular polysaccharide biosynthesis acetyltransferase n=1 Tax=Polaribacter sp. Hel1_85 TaxID=1250005 RepID=UPI00052D1DFD|nr:WcaF family extracellular polysaccharide biosynthesis acetyltransferase [Polaribacter sp. Hel1_85]KGL64350.1 acetyltransferase [Polaribacter sp. Hel1_85]